MTHRIAEPHTPNGLASAEVRRTISADLLARCSRRTKPGPFPLTPAASGVSPGFLEPWLGMISLMNKGGRPSKGDRYAAKTRLPRPVADAVWAIHEETGMPISDVIAGFVARGLGMPEYIPAASLPFDQEELPLKTA